MRIARLFTNAGRSPYDGIAFRMAMPLDQMEGAGFEVPASWSEDACEALAERCFGLECVPTERVAVVEGDIPLFLWRHRAAPGARLVRECDARQVFDRIAGAWTYQGWRGGYFDTEDDALAFFDEIRFMLCRQVFSPEAAQWAYTGLDWAYGTGDAVAGWIVDHRSGALRAAERGDLPAHGAAIVAAASEDDGPFAAWQEEWAAVAQGLDVGHCVTEIPAGRLAAMLSVGNSVAAASGAPAARRELVLDASHPGAADFVGPHARDAQRDAALATGAQIAARHIEALAAACRVRSRKSLDPAANPALRLALIAAREAGLPDDLVERAVMLARQGRSLAEYPTLAFDPDADDGAASRARHLLRIAGGRLEDPAALNGIALAGWMAEGSGVFFAAAAEAWNGCAADGPIKAAAADLSFPFLDGTSCVRATLDLLAFRSSGGTFDAARFAHAARLATVALDLTISLAAQPSRALSEGTWRYRPVGLGFANLGPLLLGAALGYDTREARATAAAVAALMGATACAVSAEMAEELGAFPRFAANRDAMLRVLRNHRRAAEGAREDYQGMAHAPAAFDADACPDRALAEAARAAWARAVALAEAHGLRNAQTTSIGPLRTSERIMGCESFGIEPDAAPVKYERLPGGAFGKVVNPHLAPALARLGYDADKVAAIVAYVLGHGTLDGAPGIDHRALRARGFTSAALQALEAAAAQALDIRLAFNQWTLGEEFCTRVLGISARDLDDYGFDMPKALGFSPAEVDAANAWCCGAQTLEGAPHLDPAHLGLFDFPRRQGRRGKRALAPAATLRMMGAIQPFLSGGIGRTLAMPAEATVEDCARMLWSAWGLGLKGLVLARESDPAALAEAPLRAAEAREDSLSGGAPERAGGGTGPAPAARRERLVLIPGSGPGSGGEPPGAAAPRAPQPTAHAASQALAIALTARGVAASAAAAVDAIEPSQEYVETCGPDCADRRCPDCGGFAPSGAECGICGAVHGCRD